MRALVLDGNGVRFQRDRPDPAPVAGEVLVRVARAGICATDLQLIRGYKGFSGVLGHEFVGVALGGAFEGRRVVGEINCSCWACETCLGSPGGGISQGDGVFEDTRSSGDREAPGRREGRPSHCPNRTVIGILNHDGVFADLVAVPERNLHAVPDGVGTDAAVFTEPLAAAFQIPAQIAISRDDRIVVLGDGRLGNLCAQVLAGSSDHVVVVGKHPGKLALLDAMGIETKAAGQAHGGADIVVDCTGSASGLTAALALVRPRGTIVLKTTIAGPLTLDLAPAVVDEVTIVGSRCGPFDRALDALTHGLIDVQGLISDRFDLSSGVRALGRAGEPGVLKVLLDVS